MTNLLARAIMMSTPLLLGSLAEVYAERTGMMICAIEGIFLIGASMGGLSSFQIAQSEQFPVIAQVGYCPVTDLFKQAYCNPWTTASYQRSHIASYFGFAGTQPTFTDSKYPSAAEIEFYRQNLDKTVAYSPILHNVVDGDVASIFGVIPRLAGRISAFSKGAFGVISKETGSSMARERKLTSSV